MPRSTQSEHSPPLTGGSGRTGRSADKLRDLPDVTYSACPNEYARFLCEGFDSLQEAFALRPNPDLVELLERSKRDAQAQRFDHSGVVKVALGSEQMKVHATGAKGGIMWVVSNDDFMYLIRAPEAGNWCISCRYLSAGLWEHGAAALRERSIAALRPHTTQTERIPVVVSRADWAFDFWSPALTTEVKPGLVCNVVAHSSVKKMEFGTVTVGQNGQTVTLGKIDNLQLQLYNKSLEIDEASGKTWFWQIWVAGLDGEWPWEGERPRDVWRLELRFGKSFLKERNVRQPHQFDAALPNLITEALHTRRLVTPDQHNSNTRRWPMHPIWSEAARICGSRQMLPIGRKVTGLRRVLSERAHGQIAGSIISAMVLKTGGFDERKIGPFLNELGQRAIDHPKLQRKEEAAKFRYSDVDEAK